MHILIITDSYPPEVRSAAQLMSDLAKGLFSLGHKVTVATSFPGYNLAEGLGDLKEKENENGVEVLRIKTLPHHKVNFIIRGLAQLTMPWIFFRKIKKLMPELADVVYVHSPPLPLYITALKLKKLWGSKFVLNVHDIFPQNAVDLGVIQNSFIIKFFEKMEQRAYRKSDAIITPSEEHKYFLSEKRKVSPDKIEVAEHWIDINSFSGQTTGEFKKRWGLQNKFVFVFGGVIGPSQGLDIFIKAAEELVDYSQIHFLFVGDGTDKDRLMELSREKNLKNVSFVPFISPEVYPGMLRDMDVAMLSLTNKNTTPAVPAKLMGYMAAGMPVLGLLHSKSEAIRIINEANGGLAAEYGNVELAVELILKMYKEKDKLAEYSRNSENYAMQHFDKNVVIPKIAKIIESL